MRFIEDFHQTKEEQMIGYLKVKEAMINKSKDKKSYQKTIEKKRDTDWCSIGKSR